MIVRAPTASDDVLNVHEPDDNVQVPIVVPPSRNVMVPVAAELLTVPVSVTGDPTEGVLELAVTDAVTGERYVITTLPVPSDEAVVIEVAVADGSTYDEPAPPPEPPPAQPLPAPPPPP